MAEVTIAPQLPDDLDAIMRLIESHEGASGKGQGVPSEIYQKDGEVSFYSCTDTPCNGAARSLQAMTSFDLKSKTIRKNIHLKRQDEEARFTATLVKPDKVYEATVYHGPHADVLLFLNKSEVFIYTQNLTPSGAVELKEWIYARRPNAAGGSEYVWQFHPDIWGWPLSLEKGPGEDTGLFRNIPVNGVPFADKKDRAHVIDSVNKISAQYKMYFPFHEKISNIPPVVYWNREGIRLRAQTAVADKGSDAALKKPRRGPDWRFLYSLEKNMFKVFIPASRGQYPLLIDPSLMFEESEA